MYTIITSAITILLSITAGFLLHSAYLRLFINRKSSYDREKMLFQLVNEGDLFRMDLNTVSKKLTEAGAAIMNCGRCSIWLYNDDCSVVRCVDMYSAHADEHRSGDELRCSDFPAYVEAHKTQLVVVAGDVYADPRTMEIPEVYLRSNNITSLIDVPFHSRNMLCGIVSFEHTGKPRKWKRDDERLAMELTTLISLCIESGKINHTKDELYETELRLKNAGDNLRGGLIYQVIVRSDGTRSFTHVSAGVKELYGVTPEQVIATPSVLHAQIHEDDIGLLIRGEEESVRYMQTFDAEVRYHAPSGEIRWLRLLSHPRLMKNGDVIFDGLEIDITERKRQEALLRESEQNLRITLDSIGDSVISTDMDGKITRMNPAASRLTGWDANDAMGKNISDVFRIKYPGQQYSRQGPVEEVLRTGSAVSLRTGTNLISRNGKKFRIMDSAAPIINESGQSAGVVLVFRDVTEQVRLEKEAMQNALSFRTIFEASPYSIVIQRASDSRYVMVNPAFEKISGMPADQIIGKTMKEMGRSVNPDDEILAIETLKTLGKIDNMVIRNITNDGKENHTLFSSRVIEFNNETCVLSVTVDITETRKIQQQLNQAQKMDAIGQLAGGIAHDFNNMLGGILGAAELLQIHSGENITIKKYIQMIRTTAERAASLTAKLMAFSRKSTIEYINIDLHRCIQDTAELLARTIDKKINITLRLDASEHVVSGDISQLINIFLNLGINAAQAMPDGGDITFTSSTIDLDEPYRAVNLPELQAGRFILVDIHDTGCGIPPENLDKIFEPFFTTKGKGKGTGLGLASVYGSIRQHNGSITVYSEPGRGTVFHVYLPLASGNQAEPVARKDLIHGRGCILVIDDEEIMRITAMELLQYLGYKVLLAANGREGIEIFKKEKNCIDLVLLDMVMPVMNGRECFMELKKIDPEARIVISSGFVLDEKISEMDGAGLAGFIRKPFQASELGKVIAGALSRDQKD